MRLTVFRVPRGSHPVGQTNIAMTVLEDRREKGIPLHVSVQVSDLLMLPTMLGIIHLAGIIHHCSANLRTEMVQKK